MKIGTSHAHYLEGLEIFLETFLIYCDLHSLPQGHAYAAVISACAAGGDWMRAVSIFEEMTESGVNPDVVSCTALVNALASCGEADKAEAVVKWMLANGLSPNVSEYAWHGPPFECRLPSSSSSSSLDVYASMRSGSPLHCTSDSAWPCKSKRPRLIDSR